MNERPRSGRRTVLMGMVGMLLASAVGHRVIDADATVPREGRRKKGGAFGGRYRPRKSSHGTVTSTPLPPFDPRLPILGQARTTKSGTKHKGLWPVRISTRPQQVRVPRQRLSKKQRMVLRNAESPFRCEECGKKMVREDVVIFGNGRICSACETVLARQF